MSADAMGPERLAEIRSGKDIEYQWRNAIRELLAAYDAQAEEIARLRGESDTRFEAMIHTNQQDAARIGALTAERDALRLRVAALEEGLLGAGRLYGFETGDGLPCWCDSVPGEDHDERCAGLRTLLADTEPRP